MKFACLIGIFLNSANLICRSTVISKCFRGSLRLRDYESRLYNKAGSIMGSCYSGDHIAEDHIHTDITTCNIEELDSNPRPQLLQWFAIFDAHEGFLSHQ